MRTTRVAGSRGPALLLAAAAIASFGNFGFHAVGSRLLGPGDYSSLAALMALLVIVAVPVGAVQTAATQASATSTAASAVATVERSTQIGIIVLFVGLALALPLDRALGLHDGWGVPMTAAWAAVACVGAVAKGALLGRLRYAPVSLALLAGAAARLALAFVLIPALGVEGAMLATVVGEALAACVAVLAMRGDLLSLRAPSFRAHSSDATVALFAQLGLWVLAGITTMLARRVLPTADAGNFAAASTVTNAAAFLPLAVATAFFPHFARDGSRPTFYRALGLALFFGAGLAAVLVIAPGTAVAAVAGNAYRADVAVVSMLAVQSALVGCAGVAMFFLLARRRPAALVVWGGAIAASLGSVLVHDARGLAFVAMAGAAIGAGATVVSARRATVPRPDHDLTLVLPEPDRLLTVVVPSYNGGFRLRSTVEALCRSLDATGWSFEVVVEIDGSTDGSGRTLAGISPNVVVDESVVNGGKGAALRRGFTRARGVYIGFIDGDGDIDVEIVRKLARACQQSGVWAAIASKHAAGAEVRMSAPRVALSRGYRRLVRVLFSLDVSDTQCGAKVFTRRGIERALPRTRENGFALDVELLGFGRRLELGDVVELPVRLHRGSNRTTVSARHVMRTLEGTLRVWSRVIDAPVTVTSAEPAVTVANIELREAAEVAP